MKLKAQKYKEDLSFYLGTWRNPYEDARLIREFSISEGDEGLHITVKNSEGSFYQGPWEIAKLRPHAYAPEISDIVAFQARFDMEEMEAFFAINENRGLLIIAAYLTFKGDDSRSDCFVREFFYKV